MTEIFNNWKIILLLCFTLGLAPFTPEPHIVEKLRLLINGAEGMRAIDVFDLLMHGAPFILLFIWLFRSVLNRNRKAD